MAILNLQGTTIPCDKLEHMLDIGVYSLGGGAWVRLYLITPFIVLRNISVQSHFACSVHEACNV